MIMASPAIVPPVTRRAENEALPRESRSALNNAKIDGGLVARPIRFLQVECDPVACHTNSPIFDLLRAEGGGGRQPSASASASASGSSRSSSSSSSGGRPATDKRHDDAAAAAAAGGDEEQLSNTSCTASQSFRSPDPDSQRNPTPSTPPTSPPTSPIGIHDKKPKLGGADAKRFKLSNRDLPLPPPANVKPEAHINTDGGALLAPAMDAARIAPKSPSLGKRKAVDMPPENEPKHRKPSGGKDETGKPAAPELRGLRVRGLFNPHNYCYRNSVMQLIGSCHDFVHRLHAHDRKTCHVKGLCLTCQMSEFYRRHYQKPGRAVSLNGAIALINRSRAGKLLAFLHR